MLPLLSTLLFTATAAAPADSPVVTFPEIVVTGNRVGEDLSHTPAAISVVDRATYDDTRGISLKDALSFVPGVFVQSRGGAEDVRITIRGFGARGNGERSNAGNLRGIRILTDGVPITEPDGRTSLDLVDLGSTDRIEVSRSNVSALYGNASGGVVDLQSSLDFTSPFIELRARAGSFGYHREQGRAGFTMGEARGTGMIVNSTYDGWREHSSSSATKAKVMIATPVGEDTKLQIGVDAVSDLIRFPGPLTRAQADSAPEQANARFVTRDDRRRNRLGRVALGLDRPFNEAHRMELRAYVEPKVLERSERGRFRDFNRYHVGGSGIYEWRRPIDETRANRLIVGFDEAFQDGSILFYTLSPDGGRGDELVANQREGANAFGGFVEDRFDLGNLSLSLALRYDALWYISEDRIDPSLDDSKTFEHVTPKAGASYRWNPNHSLYAALGGGVEMPAFNEIDPPAPYDTLTALNPFLDPMRSTTFEVGARGAIDLGADGAPAGEWPGTFTYDTAVYWIGVKDEIVPQDGGAFFLSAGESRRIGFEMGGEWRPEPPLSLSLALTLSDNEYVEYSNELGDLSGNEVPGLPSTVVTGAVGLALPAGFSAQVDVEAADDYFADDGNTAATRSYFLVNLTGGYSRAIGASTLRASLSLLNAADKTYDASVFINGLNEEYFEPGLPRNWALALTWRY